MEVCGGEGAAKEQQRQVDVGPTVVADHQATEALEPSEGTLDDPALATQGGLLLPSHSDVAAQLVHSAEDAIGAVVIGFICVRGLDALMLWSSGSAAWAASTIVGKLKLRQRWRR